MAVDCFPPCAVCGRVSEELDDHCHHESQCVEAEPIPTVPCYVNSNDPFIMKSGVGQAVARKALKGFTSFHCKVCNELGDLLTSSSVFKIR